MQRSKNKTDREKIGTTRIQESKGKSTKNKEKTKKRNEHDLKVSKALIIQRQVRRLIATKKAERNKVLTGALNTWKQHVQDTKRKYDQGMEIIRSVIKRSRSAVTIQRWFKRPMLLRQLRGVVTNLLEKVNVSVTFRGVLRAISPETITKFRLRACMKALPVVAPLFANRYKTQERAVKILRPVVESISRPVRKPQPAPPLQPQVLRFAQEQRRFESYKWNTIRDMVQLQLELLLVYNLPFDHGTQQYLDPWGFFHYEYLLVHPWLQLVLWKSCPPQYHISLICEAAKNSPFLQYNSNGVRGSPQPLPNNI